MSADTISELGGEDDRGPKSESEPEDNRAELLRANDCIEVSYMRLEGASPRRRAAKAIAARVVRHDRESLCLSVVPLLDSGNAQILHTGIGLRVRRHGLRSGT